MSAFPPSGLTRSRLNKVYISNELYVNTIKPYNSDFPITIEGGSVVLDDIVLTDENSFVGDGAGDAITTGIYNVFLGSNAGNLNTTGISNTFLGFQAGAIHTTGSANVFIGESSGANSTTSFSNTFVGRYTGISVTTGSSNVFVGQNSGSSVITGASNVIIGNSAGQSTTTTLTGCVLIGNNAGQLNDTDNRLMIDNTNTDRPLLDGTFGATADLSTLQINGNVKIGSITNKDPRHTIYTTFAAGGAAPAKYNGYLYLFFGGDADSNRIRIPFINDPII